MVELSIVIPCFNHGVYLRDALNSVDRLVASGTTEVLIVNDGSTEAATLDILNELQRDGFRILHQKNLGLAEARNNGIKATSGPFILPLDSDNLIIDDFVTSALTILRKQTAIDVVYSDSLQFGEREFYNAVGDFDACKLINDNYIDACAIYRRQVWEDVGGYDKNMPVMGHEDWEFWVTALIKNKVFHYLPMAGFRYRIRHDSMLRKVTVNGGEKNRNYIYRKHNYQLFECIRKHYNPNPENYKSLYLRLVQDLENNRVKNIGKLLFGKQFV